jgi:hypothetical protein
MTYIGLGPRQATAAGDATGLNTGNLTTAFTASLLGFYINQFECYHIVVTNVPSGGQGTVWIGARQYGFTFPSTGSEWDPSQPMLLNPGTDLNIFWNLTANSGTTGSGSLNSPSSFSVIALPVFPAAGTYTVTWEVTLSGTLSATETDNFQLYKNESVLEATSVNPDIAGTYQQAPFSITVNGGETLALTNPLAGTSGSVYSGTVTLTTAATQLPVVTAWFRYDPSVPGNS